MKEVNELFKDLYYEIKYYIGIMLYPTLCIMSMALPIVCFLFGVYFRDIEVQYAIPTILAIQFLFYMERWVLKKEGKGNEVPVPRKRFTSVSDDGEVSIETSRTQELILYMGDLEDLLERKGKL